MISKMLAHIGFGGATIEALLDEEATELGGKLRGKMIIQGGAVDQEVTGILAELFTLVKIEGSDSKVSEDRCIASYKLADCIALHPGERRELPFALDLPLHTPVILGPRHGSVWLRTKLDLPMAVDAADKDALLIRPAPVQIDAVDAMRDFGFELVKSDTEHRSRWDGPHGHVQEFEFRPSEGAGNMLHDEVELVFQPDEAGGFALLVQIDRSARNISGVLAQATETGEDWHRLPLSGKLQGPGRAAIVEMLRPLLT